MLVSGPYGHVNKRVKLVECLSTCKFKWCLLFVALFCFFLCLSEFGLGEFDFVSSPLGRRQERRVVSSRRRRLSLTHAFFPLGHPCPAKVEHT
jgi:hypothetical protein